MYWFLFRNSLVGIQYLAASIFLYGSFTNIILEYKFTLHFLRIFVVINSNQVEYKGFQNQINVSLCTRCFINSFCIIGFKLSIIFGMYKSLGVFKTLMFIFAYDIFDIILSYTTSCMYLPPLFFQYVDCIHVSISIFLFPPFTVIYSIFICYVGFYFERVALRILPQRSLERMSFQACFSSFQARLHASLFSFWLKFCMYPRDFLAYCILFTSLPWAMEFIPIQGSMMLYVSKKLFLPSFSRKLSHLFSVICTVL